MTTLDIYLLTTLLPNLNDLLCFGCGVSVIITVALLTFNSETPDGTIDKWLPRTLLAFIVCGALSLPIPNNKQVMMIVGGYMVNNSAAIKALPDAAATTLLDYLKKIEADTVKKDDDK